MPENTFPSSNLESIQIVYERVQGMGENDCLYWNGQRYSYTEFNKKILFWRNELQSLKIGKGFVCAVDGDYSPSTGALFFAMMLEKVIMVPFTEAVKRERQGLMEIAGCEGLITFASDDSWTYERISGLAPNDLVVKFQKLDRPGLIVFSSGSTGKPKGILQDCENVMKKFVKPRPAWRTILFLMMDHFGGFNTFLSAFAYGGVAICLPSRSPEAICESIQNAKATLLPTTPTFLNLLFASGSYRMYDLSSVAMITYGTEVMSESTLKKIKDVFPNAQLKQTYGLSELGVLRSKSESNDSVWVRVGGDGFEVKVIENILWVRSSANMVGYLNAPQPFDEDGWMCTGDEVEVRGEYLRIIGRKSEMINVGGQKVFPAEVESVLLEDANIKEATVYGVPHPIMGKIVMAQISLHQIEELGALTARLKKHCMTKIAKFKIPVKFVLVEQEDQRSERFKKIRKIDTVDSEGVE